MTGLNGDVQTTDRTELFRALWEGVAGLFAGAGYIVEFNYEYGDGRPDVSSRKNRNAV